MQTIYSAINHHELPTGISAQARQEPHVRQGLCPFTDTDAACHAVGGLG